MADPEPSALSELPDELPDDLLDAIADLILHHGSSMEACEPGLEALGERFPAHARAARAALELMLAGQAETVDAGSGAASHLGDAELPERIGPYRIVERLGAGGMGVVYAGEQHEPVRRSVAVKVVRKGLATVTVLRRFRLERRALAAMSHGAIAKVFEAGETAGGEPYFAMELVSGLPITDYCDAQRLSLRERLELFRKVCAGVQHAHQKGVIHRDLKPGNILVHREGDEHLPKILDFGLAKATNQDFLGASLHTEQNGVLGTPEYMSPEQAAGKLDSIDVRADVYSLGVVLYELVTGQRPFRTEQLRRVGLREALRIICEDEPQRPSTRLQSSEELTSESASRRLVSSAALTRACRGDLDWVVMRCLEKEPARRYESANALAMEVQRYLNHEPVLAGPPSSSYRLKKLLRRHRLAVAALAAVFLALLAGGIATWTEFDRAERNFRAASASAIRYRTRTEEFDQLKGVVLHERAVQAARSMYPAWPAQVPSIESWFEVDAARLLSLRPVLDATLESLRKRAMGDRSNAGEPVEFERDEDAFLFRTLSGLVGDMEEFESGVFAEMKAQRLRWARYLRDELETSAAWRAAWSTAAQEVAASERYGDWSAAGLQPQTGLFPLGANPVTGLQEFYHLRSAWDELSDPADIVMPSHDPATGAVEVGEQTGIVFVLVPGGTTTIGAQSHDPQGAHYDAAAIPQEMPAEVSLDPFFLARHELTHGQWKRLARGVVDPEPGYWDPGTESVGQVFTASHPVEEVDWFQCDRLLACHGLGLPTEAQWEYGCSAGTSTPWWTGAERESLIGFANLADQSARVAGFDWFFIDKWPEFRDGFAATAPVDALPANPWGFHHVHGNVWEWCLDGYAAYATLRDGDGKQQAENIHGTRIYRGGSYIVSAENSRSRARIGIQGSVRTNDLGVRPARRLTRAD